MEGKGTLIVGDTINYYKKGDVMVIGSHLPHVFKSDYSLKKPCMLTLFFRKNSFGNDIFEREELQELQKFFKRSKHGYKVIDAEEQMKRLFLQLENASKLNQFLILLQLLKHASTCDYMSLSSIFYDKKYSDNEGRRMCNVFEYTMTHFADDISLENISKVANMIKNAFCNYFKKSTNKTYIQFLTELRIAHSFKLLQSKNENSIGEVTEASGISNVSNFNRQFKPALGITPLCYRKTISK